MATSNQYNFPSIDVDYILREAFERCGIEDWQESGLYYDGANRSLDFILSHWMNLGLNLFTVQQGIIPVIAGQTKFELPQETLFEILESNLVKANQILGGTADSSDVESGSATSIFQTIPGACELSDPDGDFTYKYTTGQPILYVGILTNETKEYTISIDCALTATPTDADWITVLDTPPTIYYVGQPQWWILPFQKTAVFWRIRETGGAILNLAQISLDIPYQFQPMVPVARDLYFMANTNSTQGNPTSYWHDRSSQPSLNVYPWANDNYQFFVYNYTNYIQDVGSYLNSLDIRGCFLESAVSALAAKLALKYAFERYDSLKAEADTAYIQAGGKDTEKVDSQITGVGEW